MVGVRCGGIRDVTDNGDGSPPKDWQEIAKRVVSEQNPEKLCSLVESLIAAFDEQRASKKLEKPVGSGEANPRCSNEANKEEQSGKQATDGKD
jgi:hypothetical protein